MIGNVIFEMVELNGSDTRRIAHALKVYGLAKCIADRENVPPDQTRIIEIAAALHDIAIRHCEETYGACTGRLQEREGPAIARPILEKYGLDETLIARVLYIIAHHHTYDDIDGIDYQIVVEADFLVNVQEGDLTKKAFSAACKRYFKTRTGKEMAAAMNLLT